MSEKLTHIALAKELGDMIRTHSKEPNQLPALQETVKTWWYLLTERHYEDLKSILDDLYKIDELLAISIPPEERTFLELTKQVLTSEKSRHECELTKLIGAVGGQGRYGMLAAMFPHLDDYVHIASKEVKR